MRAEVHDSLVCGAAQRAGVEKGGRRGEERSRWGEAKESNDKRNCGGAHEGTAQLHRVAGVVAGKWRKRENGGL